MPVALRLLAVALTAAALAACAQQPPVMTSNRPAVQEGARTASGEKFDKNELTAAHRTLPFGTRLRVTDVDTGRSVTVRVNDRGPFVRGRVVDVSASAAETLGITGKGVAKVKVDVVEAGAK